MTMDTFVQGVENKTSYLTMSNDRNYMEARGNRTGVRLYNGTFDHGPCSRRRGSFQCVDRQDYRRKPSLNIRTPSGMRYADIAA